MSEEEHRLKFYGNFKLGGHYLSTPHPDWVRYLYKDPTLGFTVQTLHRDSFAWDDLKAGGGGAGGGAVVGGGVGAAGGAPFAAVGAIPGAVGGAIVGSTVGAVEGTRANRYHFLAGRRSWRLDVASSFASPSDGAKLGADVIILETAAIERFSLVEYEAGKTLMEPMIIEIWSHLLTNFAAKPGIKVLGASEWPMEPGWTNYGKVHHVMLHYKTEADLRGSSHYPDLIRLYKRIYEGTGR